MKWLLLIILTMTLTFANPVSKKVYYPPKENKSLFSKTVFSIPGKELYFGTFYKLTMLRYPKGVVSLTNETDSNGGLLLQIDYDTDNRPLYAESGDWALEDQWILNPTDEENYFTMQNRGLSIKTNSETVMTWNFELAEEGGFQVVAYSNADQYKFLKEDGKWKDRALWKVVRVAKDQYKIVNKGMSSGVFTSTDKEHGDYSYYMTIDYDFSSMAKYEPGGEWYKDAIFTFTPVKMEREVEEPGDIVLIEYTLDYY